MKGIVNKTFYGRPVSSIQELISPLSLRGELVPRCSLKPFFFKERKVYFFSLSKSNLSKWIANLGVVPLLLLRALRFFPIFTFLFSLLFLVTRVLETIIQLLLTAYSKIVLFISHLNIHLRPSLNFSFLKEKERGEKFSENLKTTPTNVNLCHNFKHSVKGFAQYSLLTLLLGFSLSLELKGNQDVNDKFLNLAKGEIKQIQMTDIQKFTLGNKEVISVKPMKNNGGLLLKATHLGLSDLIIWGKKGEKHRFQVNVVQKRTSQKLNLMARKLRSKNIRVEIGGGGEIFLQGVLKTNAQLREILKIRYKLKEKLHLEDLKFSPQMRKKHYAQLLKEIFSLNLISLDCSPKELYIECKEVTNTLIKKSLSYIDKKFLIRWIPQDGSHATKQFEVSLTLQQYENKTGESFSLGLNKLQGSWEKILSDSPLSLIKKNDIHLEDNEFKTATLAHPTIRGRFNEPIKIKVGQEILFLKNLNSSFSSQQWKFAGLDIKITLHPLASGIIVYYQTSLSQPGGEIMTKNTQQSSIITAEGESTILFDIGFQMNKRDQSRFPGLSQIPLFGALFKNNFHSTTYKKILCLINVKEI